MIKSLLSNYLTKYFVNITPSNMSLHLLSQTIDLYNVALNPLFIPNTKSSIKHIKYQFKLTRGNIIINDMVVHLSSLDFLRDASESSNDIIVYNTVLIYEKFEIKINEISNGNIKDIEIYYNNIKCIFINNLSHTLNGYCIVNCNIYFAVLLDNCEKQMSSCNLVQKFRYYVSLIKTKYEISIDNIKINNGMCCIKNINILENDFLSCCVRKLSFYDTKLFNVCIKISDTTIMIDDIILVSYNSTQITFKILKNIFNKKGTGVEYFNLQHAFNLLGWFDNNFICIMYLDNMVDFVVKGNNVCNLNISNILEIDKIEYTDNLLVLSNVRLHSSNMYIESTKNSDLDLLSLFEIISNHTIIINNLYLCELFVKEICINNIEKKQKDVDKHEALVSRNYIELVEIDYANKLFNIHAYNVFLLDPIVLISYFTDNTSSVDYNLTLNNLFICYIEYNIIFSILIYTNSKLNCTFDLLINGNYVIEDCYLKYSNNNFIIEKLFCNYSETIVDRILNSKLYELFINKCKYTTNECRYCLCVESIVINLYTTAHIEIFSIFLWDVVLCYSVGTFSISVVSAQIDNQEYNTKTPIIFKSLGANCLTANIANRECYVNIDKFKIVYEDFMNFFLFIKKTIMFSSDSLQTVKFNIIIVNNLDFSVFYKFVIDVKLETYELSNFEGTFNVLYETMYDYYYKSIKNNLFKLIINNVKNNVFFTLTKLSYKDDGILPMPWYKETSDFYRIKYPMPSRPRIEKHNFGLCAAFYIFNKFENKYKNEVFKDGTYAQIVYRDIPNSALNDKNCLILTNKRMLLSTKLSIKEVCMHDLSFKENTSCFMIGIIKITVDRKTFINSLCEFFSN